jgi:DNA polymerase-3 subunit alpha/error-prone DNA polymerase
LHEARLSGAIIHNPCVNKSEYLTTVYGKDVYIGLNRIEKVEADLKWQMVQEREKHGNYSSLEDFVNRIPIAIESLQRLIFIGAFRFTGKTNNELALAARLLLVNFKPENRDLMLLQEPVVEYQLPQLVRSPFEDAFDEIEILSFPVSHSHFDLLQTNYRGDVLVKDLLKYHQQYVKMLAFLVSIKQNPTKQGMMAFGTWIDVEGNFFDTAHFNKSFVAYPFQGAGCYLLYGRVEVDYHFPTVNIFKMAKMPYIPDPRYANSKSRQFTTQEHMKPDISTTHRAPYPDDKDIGLPRHKMT